jgi:hypothetical protein
MLVRALGETRCRTCTWTKPGGGAGARTDTRLADEVEAALQRRFGR